LTPLERQRMTGSIDLVREGTLARVSLHHRGKFNAMSRSMWRDLKTTFEALQQDTTVRCVVVQGADGHFCAGGDIAEYPGFRFDAAQLQQFHEGEVWGALQAMLDCDVPLIAHIEGNCMGAGLEIASCCDLRLAGSSARFGAPIARLGFPMAPREAGLVSAAVGATTARAMLLSAAVFDAAHMQTQGFLTHQYADDQLAEQVRLLTGRIVSLAPQAARMNKKTLRALNTLSAPVESAQAATKSIAFADDSALSSAYDYADSAEHREGIDAFLNKRPPIF
jgi:enoyl-CoA hydratase/carnithine racemase